jgi:Leucine-rich repeat (LRR) protein
MPGHTWSPVPHAQPVQVLQLGGNHVASISSLQLGSLTSLRTLFLNNNNISRVDGLQGLANLQVCPAGTDN